MIGDFEGVATGINGQLTEQMGSPCAAFAESVPPVRACLWEFGWTVGGVRPGDETETISELTLEKKVR